MIDEIRAYIKTTMKRVDSDLKEHNSPVIAEDIPSSLLDYRYALQIGSTSNLESNMTHSLDSIDVNVQIFDKGVNCTMDKYVDLYCKAHKVRLEACKRPYALSNDNVYIDNVQLISIVPSIIDGNENGFRIDILLNITTSIKLNGL